MLEPSYFSRWLCTSRADESNSIPSSRAILLSLTTLHVPLPSIFLSFLPWSEGVGKTLFSPPVANKKKCRLTLPHFAAASGRGMGGKGTAGNSIKVRRRRRRRSGLKKEPSIAVRIRL